MSALPVIALGATVGWLTSTLVFLLTQYSSPLLALSILYGFIIWEFRWWPQLRLRVPFAIFGGATVLTMFRPIVSGRFIVDTIGDLLHLYGPFSGVNFALAGGTLFVIIAIAMAPMTPSDRFLERDLREKGG